MALVGEVLLVLLTPLSTGGEEERCDRDKRWELLVTNDVQTTVALSIVAGRPSLQNGVVLVENLGCHSRLQRLFDALA